MTLLQHTPTYTGSDAISIVKHLYAIRATASPLPSERDQNFLMTAETGDRFVLKIANALENRTMLDAQNQVMQHLGRHVEFCPRILATKAGELISKIQSAEGKTYFARLVSYLPGIPLATAGYHSPALLTDLGRRMGQMDRAMADFDHPGAHRDFHWDLANALQVVREHQALIQEPSLREKIEKCADAFERDVVPLFPKLRKSVIHNDANDYNVIVGGGNDPYTRNQGVVGIIDFGDLVYSYTIGNLAIAAAYAVLDKPDPLKTAALVTTGYHAEYPLEEEEISVLFACDCA